MASSAAVRRQLYELEHGICQICKVDAALQYRTVKSLAAGEERLQYLMRTEHRLRGRLDKMLIDPKEGDFWQVARFGSAAALILTQITRQITFDRSMKEVQS